MLGGPRQRSGFPPPSGRFTPPLCGLVLLRRSHSGQDLIEYALLAGFISLVAVLAITTVGVEVDRVYEEIGGVVEDIGPIG